MDLPTKCTYFHQLLVSSFINWGVSYKNPGSPSGSRMCHIWSIFLKHLNHLKQKAEKKWRAQESSRTGDAQEHLIPWTWSQQVTTSAFLRHGLLSAQPLRDLPEWPTPEPRGWGQSYGMGAIFAQGIPRDFQKSEQTSGDRREVTRVVVKTCLKQHLPNSLGKKAMLNLNDRNLEDFTLATVR